MGSIQGIVNKEIPLSSFINSFTDPGKQQARIIFSYCRASTSHGLHTISIKSSFTIALTEIVKVKLVRPRFLPPPLLHRHDPQCPENQPVSLVTQHRRTTPVPTPHPQSLYTLDHHRRDLVFPGWIRQHSSIWKTTLNYRLSWQKLHQIVLSEFDENVDELTSCYQIFEPHCKL